MSHSVTMYSSLSDVFNTYCSKTISMFASSTLLMLNLVTIIILFYSTSLASLYQRVVCFPIYRIHFQENISIYENLYSDFVVNRFVYMLSYMSSHVSHSLKHMCESKSDIEFVENSTLCKSCYLMFRDDPPSNVLFLCYLTINILHCYWNIYIE